MVGSTSVTIVGGGGLVVVAAAGRALAVAGVANGLGVAGRHTVVGHVVVHVLPLVIHGGVFGGFQRAVIGRVVVAFQGIGRAHLPALLAGRKGRVLVRPAGGPHITHPPFHPGVNLASRTPSAPVLGLGPVRSGRAHERAPRPRSASRSRACG